MTLTVDDQFILNGLTCGPSTDYPQLGDAQTQGWDFFPAAEPRRNDQPLSFGDGVSAGTDTFGGRLLILDGEFFVQPETTVMDLTKAVGQAFAMTSLAVPFTFRHQGTEWTYFGRPNGASAVPDTPRWTWVGEFMCIDPRFYGPEQTYVGTTHTAAAGGTVASRQWRCEVAGPCTNPTIGYTTDNGADVTIAYTLTVASGSTLIVTNFDPWGVARAYTVDGSGNITKVPAPLVSSRPQVPRPLSSGERHFSFTSDSGGTPSWSWRDGFTL